MSLSLILPSLAGGVLIGLAATLMLLCNGRVTGVSGILGGFITSKENRRWQGAFLAGLFTGGAVLIVIKPDVFMNLTDRTRTMVLVAGLLVGFGTSLGGGCTSGHGICGVSRFSTRSMLATLTFMLFGFLTVTVLRFWVGS